MTEVDWIDEESAAPKKKRGLPKWVWGCGCGCFLLFLVLGIVLGVAGQRLVDSERQWPRLQESLWFDERPAEFELDMGFKIPFIGTKYFTLADKMGRFTASITDYGPGSSGEKLDTMFATEADEVPTSFILPRDPVLGELEIQGRTLRVLRFRKTKMEPGNLIGPGVRIDFSIGDHHRMLELRSTDPQTALTDEEVVEFFEHFDPWHEQPAEDRPDR